MFVRTARRHRIIQIRVGHRTLTAQAPLPPDLCDALALIKQPMQVRTNEDPLKAWRPA